MGERFTSFAGGVASGTDKTILNLFDPAALPVTTTTTEAIDLLQQEFEQRDQMIERASTSALIRQELEEREQMLEALRGDHGEH